MATFLVAEFEVKFKELLMLFADHNGVHGLHAFADRQGLKWYKSAKDAYTLHVEYNNNTSTTFGRRERPDLMFDERGNPHVLYTGVETAGVKRSWTLAQAVSLVPPPPTPSTGTFCKDNLCDSGGKVCCPKRCGRCGGSSCQSRPGGSAECCTGAIERAGKVCTFVGDTSCSIPAGGKCPRVSGSPPRDLSVSSQNTKAAPSEATSRPVLSILDFGAKADGETNNHRAIANAMHACA